jgi:hypothetical protein
MKAQVSLWVIMGIILVILIIVFSGNNKFVKQDILSFSFDTKNLQNFFDDCSKYAIIESNVEVGFFSNQDTYEQVLLSKIDECMNPFMLILENKGYEIIKKEASSNIEINENTLIVTIIYPQKIKYEENEFEFNDYTHTLSRIVYLDLKDIDENPIISSDNLFRVDLDEDVKIIDIYGEDVEAIYLRIGDKDEFENAQVTSNLVYGLLPTGSTLSKPTRICIDKNLIPVTVSIDDLRIAWYNPYSEKWGFIDAKQDESCIYADITYATYYGLVEKRDAPNGIPGFNSDDENPAYTTSGGFGNSRPPNPNYKIYGGPYAEAFDKINSEMGGPYDLNLNSDCVYGDSQVFCFVGYVEAGCHATAVHCDAGKLNGMDEVEREVLFRHEITHSLQQKNGGCPIGDRRYSEWGSDYYAKSNYYSFVVDGVPYSADELADKMMEKDCTEDDMMDLAFCTKGVVDSMRSRDCLLSNGDIAEEVVG